MVQLTKMVSKQAFENLVYKHVYSLLCIFFEVQKNLENMVCDITISHESKISNIDIILYSTLG